MRIEFLTFEGCPNADIACERVQEALDSEGVHAAVRRVAIETPDDALRVGFLGSPSVRIDGSDVEPEAETRADRGLMCRTYTVDRETSGAPPLDM
ncbi:MAG TPA: hypothetical protein VFE36_12295 [Candidatus Baltobacteraceae bacterium]|jgi:hypothetical protein|nr:hypothetical protein [Candidatus Baltobacteraceae bacterium]